MTKAIQGKRSKPCQWCGALFEFTTARRIYCTSACKQRAFSAAHPGYMVEAQRRHLKDPVNRHRRAERMAAYRSRPDSQVNHREQQNARHHLISKDGRTGHKLRSGEWDLILQSYGYRCAYCGVKDPKLTRDHVVPISKGGPHVLGNIVPSCRPCNLKKASGPPLKAVNAVLL